MRVIDAAIGAAWAMEEGALVTLLEVAAREHQITPEALEAYKAEALKNGERAKFRDGVAIVGVEGPLFKRANLMTTYCGASSYDVMLRDFTTALDDSNVRAILLDVDSPGGVVDGCAEFAQAIFDARGKKPIVAYAGDNACSAAYWIASACDSIVVGPSASLGSIGVRCSIADTSARDARSGVIRHEFVSSQSPYKGSDPATDAGRARLQARVDALASVFVDHVARNRNVPSARVVDGFGRGDVKIGAAAVASGLADKLGTFETTLAALAASSDPFGLARAGAGPSGTSYATAGSDQAAAEILLSSLALFGPASCLTPLEAAKKASAPVARGAGDPAVEAMLTAFGSFEPGHGSGPPTIGVTADDEAAAAMLLATVPQRGRK